eukprot:14256416-Alexandrium_andersonii.AAC.2
MLLAGAQELVGVRGEEVPTLRQPSLLLVPLDGPHAAPLAAALHLLDAAGPPGHVDRRAAAPRLVRRDLRLDAE